MLRGAPGSPLRAASPTLAVLTKQPTTVRSRRRRRAKEMIRLAAAIIVRRTHLLVMRLGRERGAVDHNLRAKTHQILQELAAAFLTTGNSDIATTSPGDAAL